LIIIYLILSVWIITITQLYL